MNKKKIIYVTIITIVLVLSSCASTKQTTSDSTEVQVIDVIDTNKIMGNAKIPLTAVIQPSQLKLSPVINIATLTEKMTPMAISSTKLLDAKKDSGEKNEAIAMLEIENNKVMTSGQLATKATDQAFTYTKSSTDYAESIAEYDYIGGRIYEVIASPRSITDFRLQPGESISGTPAVTDPSSWQFTMGTSVENGVTIQHLFIRPVKVGLDTSLIVLTDKRTYYFRLASFDNQYMTAFRFRYPVQMEDGTFVDESIQNAIDNSESLDDYVGIDAKTLTYDYLIEPAKGRPSWTPQSVFSDARKTYLQFPSSAATSDNLPSVYILRDGKETLVNYRIVGNLFQVDTILSDNRACFLLKNGQSEFVKIWRY